MKFLNAPVEIEQGIRLLPIQMLNPSLRYFATAALVIEHYLHRDFGLEIRDPFLRFEKRLHDGRRWEFPARVTMVAQLLFELRNEPGFPEICRRMADRDLKSTFTEVSAAAMFKQHGFAIEAQPETFVKSADFDFRITRPGVAANVEVTAFRNALFNEKSVLGRLRDKRKQLPADKPAILMCFYPAEWCDQSDSLELDLVNAAMRFFTGTGRINYILFAREEFEEFLPAGGTISLSCFSTSNLRARHPCEALAKALERPPASHDVITDFLERPKSAVSARSPGEYFEWVDSVITR